MLFVWLRYKLDSISFVTEYVGAINAIAFIYVVMDILLQIRSKKDQQIGSSGVFSKTKFERIKKINLTVGIAFILALGISCCYLRWGISGANNDNLAIITLFFSIVSDEIVNCFAREKE